MSGGSAPGPTATSVSTTQFFSASSSTPFMLVMPKRLQRPNRASSLPSSLRRSSAPHLSTCWDSLFVAFAIVLSRDFPLENRPKTIRLRTLRENYHTQVGRLRLAVNAEVVRDPCY